MCVHVATAIRSCVHTNFNFFLEFVIVHNGIITNYKDIKVFLVSMLFVLSMYMSVRTLYMCCYSINCAYSVAVISYQASNLKIRLFLGGHVQIFCDSLL